VERNVLHVSSSDFIENAAFLAGAINFVVQDLLSGVESDVNSNQAFINKYVVVSYLHTWIKFTSCVWTDSGILNHRQWNQGELGASTPKIYKCS